MGNLPAFNECLTWIRNPAPELTLGLWKVTTLLFHFLNISDNNESQIHSTSTQVTRNLTYNSSSTQYTVSA